MNNESTTITSKKIGRSVYEVTSDGRSYLIDRLYIEGGKPAWEIYASRNGQEIGGSSLTYLTGALYTKRDAMAAIAAGIYKDEHDDVVHSYKIIHAQGV